MLIQPGKLLERQVLNPVKKLFNLVGLSYLSINTSFMFSPNDPSRSNNDRHYLYIPEIGWSTVGATLSRGSVKNRVNRTTGLIVTDAAGILGPNGQIEAASTKLCANLTDWDAPTRANRTTEQIDVVGGTNGILLYDDNTENNTHWIMSNFTCNAGSQISCRIYVKRAVGTRNIDFYAYNTGGTFTLKIDLGTLTVNSSTKTGDGTAPTNTKIALLPSGWIEITFTGICSASTANGSMYIHLLSATCEQSYNGDGASGLYLSCFGIEADVYSSTWINGAASTARTGDALVYNIPAFDALKTQGSLVWIGRAPWTVSEAIATRPILGLADGDQGGRDAIQFICYGGKPSLDFFGPAGEQAWIQGSNVAANTVFSLGVSWIENSVKMYQDGIQVGATDVNAVMPTALNNLNIGRRASTDRSFGLEHLGLFLFDRVLTDSEFAGIGGIAIKNKLSTGL